MQNPLPPTPINVAAALIFDKGRLLITQRRPDDHLPNLWEFPGGKVEHGETFLSCLIREIREELGVRVKVGSALAKVDHAYSHFKITLHAHTCQYLSGLPQTLGCRAWRWVKPKELFNFAFPAANQPLLRMLNNQNPS